MLTNLLFSKKELSRFNVKSKNSFGLTCEKITQAPRLFTTSQVINAIENISLDDSLQQKETLQELVIKVSEYILKDFFLYMHQTGLYNRQLKLWKALGNIKQISALEVKKRFQGTNVKSSRYIIDFFIDEIAPCIRVLTDETINNSYNNFKLYLSWIISSSNIRRLRGIIFFINFVPDSNFIHKIEQLTSATDSILKYESLIKTTKDTRLNIVYYNQDKNNNFIFKHIYPDLTMLRKDKLIEGLIRQ